MGVSQHEGETCPNVDVQCPLECGVRCLRRDVEQHVAEECRCREGCVGGRDETDCKGC